MSMGKPEPVRVAVAPPLMPETDGLMAVTYKAMVIPVMDEASANPRSRTKILGS